MVPPTKTRPNLDLESKREFFPPNVSRRRRKSKPAGKRDIVIEQNPLIGRAHQLMLSSLLLPGNLCLRPDKGPDIDKYPPN